MLIDLFLIIFVFFSTTEQSVDNLFIIDHNVYDMIIISTDYSLYYTNYNHLGELKTLTIDFFHVLLNLDFI